MSSEGQEVELRGVLVSISSRFWSGWGYGALMSDATLTKITGALEGHVVGTSLIVRGVYRTNGYGTQLECSSIVVDSVSGELTVIRAWARKYCKEHEDVIVDQARPLAPDTRWDFLCSKPRLLLAGVAEEAAEEICNAAKRYLVIVKLKKGLMEKGFTDNEAGALVEAYDEAALGLLESDPYLFTLDGVLSFSRVDAVVGARFTRNDRRRLQAALVQVLVSAQRNGHTAQPGGQVCQEAAAMAGVYADAVRGVTLPAQIVAHGQHLQLRSLARAEQKIALWIVASAKRGDR